jgi:glucose/arabinose dehydrogenase
MSLQSAWAQGGTTVLAASSTVPFRDEVLLTGLRQPWEMVFLPDGRALLSERAGGTLNLVDVRARTAVPLDGVPESLRVRDAGMQGIALHPDYEHNGWVYFSYSDGPEHRSTLAVDRASLNGTRLAGVERIFTADAWSEEPFHYGARLLFHGGFLYVTVGDRHHDQWAQQNNNHAGTILRLNDDGSVPADNPFAGDARARPEIWSFGHRHAQGLAVRPGTNQLWSTEHGPSGGDELNLVERGANYGWPITSYGWQYTGGPIGMGIQAREGIRPPIWVWSQSIAPSSLMFYTGDKFPQWRGDLFIGSLSRLHINRIRLAGDTVILEERLLLNSAGRVRFVVQGPDGYLYFGNDAGELRRLVPE